MTARGFSLVEMIVVLTIIGLVMSLGVVALGRGGDAARTRLAAQELSAALTATRSAAIAGARSQTLHLDLDTRRYDGPRGVSGLLPDRIGLAMTTAERERTGPRSGAIRFYPDGSATGGRIALGHNTWSRIIHVDWMTGRVRIEIPAESADAPHST